MQNTFLLLLILVLCSCIGPTDEVVPTDNEELKAIYKADQTDRLAAGVDWVDLSKRDKERLARVLELLDSNKLHTSQDYYNAAMVFQHGGDTVASRLAVEMMRKCLALDSTQNKWLLAAAIDWDLMRRGLPQIYGTQYRKNGEDAPWELYDIDTTQISDAERKEYNVETLAEQREQVLLMNKKELTELLQAGKNIDEIIAFIKSEIQEDSEYNLSEDGINMFGYQLMGQNRDEEALKIFILNTELYPEAYNTHDSYGECLVKLGRTEEGIAAYEKSLELNPKNSNAAKVLEHLKEQ